MVARLDAYGGCIHPREEDIGSSEKKLVDYWRNFPFCVVENRVIMSVPFDPEIYKLVLNDMVEESDVDLCLHCWGEEAIVEDEGVKGVIFASKQGRQAILAQVTIDTTGDGDICATAGAEYNDEITPDSGSQWRFHFRLGGIDFEVYVKFGRRTRRISWKRMKELSQQLVLEGTRPTFSCCVIPNRTQH